MGNHFGQGGIYGCVILGGTVGHTRLNPLAAFVQRSFGVQTVLVKRVRVHPHDG